MPESAERSEGVGSLQCFVSLISCVYPLASIISCVCMYCPWKLESKSNSVDKIERRLTKGNHRLMKTL